MGNSPAHWPVGRCGVVEVDKGLWAPDGGVDPVGAGLFDGPFTWPVMVLRRAAVEHNIATMAEFCTRHGVQLAPHGKTTMAPALFAAQLDAGAWGITVATAQQAAVAAEFGVPRVLLANEVLDPRVLRWAAGRPWEFSSYVDSAAGVAVLREALADSPGRLGVFIELGYPGGRTGCRDITTAVELAAAVRTIPGAAVVGVAGFEGMLPTAEAVREFLESIVDAAGALAPYCSRPPWLSAGGSRFFDVVVSTFAPPAQRHGWSVLLRSGCYVTHDHGFYAEHSPLGLQPALEVWAQVLSTPEPGLALLGAGKRDLPYDLGLPLVLDIRGHDGGLRPGSGVLVTALNDQHAYAPVTAEPGELVRLGISHPCTAFDKWRAIPVVDEAYRVVDVLRTYF